MSLIPHKEIRFIFPATAVIIILAGVGTALILERLRLLLWPAGPIWLPSSFAILAWLLTSAIIAIRGSWPGLHGLSPYIIQAETYLHERRDMCGLGLLGIGWSATSGYTRLHRPVPITNFFTTVDFLKRASSVNWLLVGADLISAPEMKVLLDSDDSPKFTIPQCWRNVCVMHREGGCTPMHGWDINKQLSDRNW
jgi:hypothetical protein